ncbi:hypothetical protein PFFVO_05978, partial [Plasmodium falciparum Vietnam Oak-Knoll (FVO)]
EHEKLTNGDNYSGGGDNTNFCQQIKEKKTAEDFLKALRHCKNSEDDTDKSEEDEKNKINFDKPENTFNPSTYCKACPIYGVTCNRGTRGCRPKIINEKNNIEGEQTDINILIDDGATNDTDNELHEKCKEYGLYTNLKKQEWKCQHKNKSYKCELQKPLNSEYYDERIPFKILFERWIIDFIQYYNKSKERITRCTNDVNSCKEGCKGNCDCVEEWLKKKSAEWEKIKDYYNQHFQDVDERIASRTKSFFEQGTFPSYAKKAQEVVEGKEEQEKLWGCTGSNTDGQTEECENGDFITNLIDRLQTKIQYCQTQHNKTQRNSCHPPPNNDEETVDDDQDTSTTSRLEFCPNIDDDSKESSSTTPEETEPDPVPKKIEDNDDACKIVKQLLGNKGAADDIDGCNRKYKGKKTEYPGWTCDGSKIKNKEVGPCMPPRRQKLCVHFLKELKVETDEKLREAFIQCSAAETFLLWHKYKTDKQNKGQKTSELDNYLNEGIIPEDFIRQMYYTFGDYRDLCMNKNIGNDVSNVENKIKDFFSKADGTSSSNLSREVWWNEYSPSIWKGMLCALSHASRDQKKVCTQLNFTYNYNAIKTYIENFVPRPPFLRWFTEWGDQFCRERGVKIEELKNGCTGYECNNLNNGEQKKKCADACKEYQEWLQDWKEQYKKQNAKFHQDKNANKYKNTSAEEDVDDVSSAHEYLHEQLEKLCDDGKCSCMENPSTQDEEIELSGINDFPEALDYPPKENKNKCECAIPPEPMSCVEKTAQKLRKIAEKNIDAKLKGNGNTYTDICKNAKREEYANQNGETCIFKEEFWSTNKTSIQTCDSNTKKRFIIDKDWDCNGKTLDGNNKLCIPPRRKDMCLNKLKNISVNDISDSTKLLEKIQEVAKNEGDDIIKNLLSKYPCNESVICDAMKYSFADIGDIIRGRSKIDLKNDNKIQEELHKIFTKIQNDKSLNNMELTELREKWWDANRKHIWNAMTCKAPKDAHLKKRIKNPGHNSQTIDPITVPQEKCAYDKEPPDYDYIPERYRFLQEWSEYYCKALKEKNDEIKSDCSTCLQNGTQCEKPEDKEKCIKCNEKCKEYKNIVKHWQSQFHEQNKIYKELYIQAITSNRKEAHSDSAINFLKKLQNICDNPGSVEKYLDKSTHCTDYVYSEINSNESSYAFSEYPMGYKAKCNCNKDSFKAKFGNTFPFIRPPVNIPNIPGLNTIKKAVAQIPKRIKNISPDAHTIHAIVARSFDYFVPLFQEDDKTPPTNNILNDVLPSVIPVGIALALTSIAFLFLK